MNPEAPPPVKRKPRIRITILLLVCLGVSVLAIGGWVLWATAPARRHCELARVTYFKMMLRQVEQALAMYQIDHGRFPSSLIELANPSLRHGRYFEFKESQKSSEGRVLDHWGQPIVYRIVGERFELYSIGPNGIDERGVGDDVRSE